VTHEVQRFVGRAAEIREAVEQIHGLQRGLAAQTCLINYYGTYGVGKQALLAELLRRAADEPGLTTVALTLPPHDSQQREPDAAEKRALVSQLAAAGAPVGDADDDQALAQAAAGLAARRGPTLLLIGADSRGTPALFGWVERGLLLPLVRAGKAAALITSRTPLRWREFDTRRRAESRELAPLTAAETAAQLGLSPEQAAPIQALTCGLPLANALAQEELASGRGPEYWGAHGAALARRIVATIYERAGPGLTPELRCALEVLAVAREFALPLIQALLPPFCPEFAQPRSQALQLATIRQLQELDLVTWNQQSLSYQITPLVRRLVASAVRREAPERYARIQRAAAAYYARQLDEVPISRHVHLAELLWHTLDGDGGALDPAATLAGLARTHLASTDGRYVDEESLAALRGRLSGDEELHGLLAARGSGLAPVLQALDGVGMSRSTAS
jgi:hypothetical protein